MKTTFDPIPKTKDNPQETEEVDVWISYDPNDRKKSESLSESIATPVITLDGLQAQGWESPFKARLLIEKPKSYVKKVFWQAITDTGNSSLRIERDLWCTKEIALKTPGSVGAMQVEVEVFD